LRVTDSETGRIVHQRTDLLGRRIGWLLLHAQTNPDTIQDWNCFSGVQMAAGKMQRMHFELLLEERGEKTDDIVAIARERAQEPFVFDWIAPRETVDYTGPIHTGIILGYDAVTRDAISFEKHGESHPTIRFWSEVHHELHPESDYVTWATLETVQADAE
jgi:hypothetical protein